MKLTDNPQGSIREGLKDLEKKLDFPPPWNFLATDDRNDDSWLTVLGAETTLICHRFALFHLLRIGSLPL